MWKQSNNQTWINCKNMKMQKYENGQNTKTWKWSKRKYVRAEKSQQDKMQICENGQNARM